MAVSRKIFADHKSIKRWAQEREGRPARAPNDEAGPASLRIKFPDEDILQEISWDEFFREFEKGELALLTLEDPEDEDDDALFYRFVSRKEDFESTLRPVEDDAPLVWPPVR